MGQWDGVRERVLALGPAWKNRTAQLRTLEKAAVAAPGPGRDDPAVAAFRTAESGPIRPPGAAGRGPYGFGAALS
jgi:hypothetical protein